MMFSNDDVMKIYEKDTHHIKTVTLLRDDEIIKIYEEDTYHIKEAKIGSGAEREVTHN